MNSVPGTNKKIDQHDLNAEPNDDFTPCFKNIMKGSQNNHKLKLSFNEWPVEKASENVNLPDNNKDDSSDSPLDINSPAPLSQNSFIKDQQSLT